MYGSVLKFRKNLERKKMKLIKSLLIVTLLTVTFAAAEEAEKQSETKDLSGVAAIVNGEKIGMDKVNSLAEMTLSRYPKQMRESQAKKIKKRVLDTIIFGELVSQKAEEMGISVSDERCEKEVTDMISSKDITLEQYKKMIEDSGKDYGELLDQVRRSLEFEKIINKLSADDVKVKDKEVKEYFNSNKEKLASPEQVKASHILIKAESDEDKQAAKEKTEELLKKINDGADFAAIAKENSDCPSSERGGDLGFFSRGRMVGAFEDAAFALDVGEMSDVVETKFGYHIILVTDKKEAKEAVFEDQKNEIREQLVNQKMGKAADKIRENMMQAATIRYSDVFKPEEKEAKKQAEKQAEGTELKIEE
nr:peptidylprolyl isomerase [Sedimentisphaera salicampi]